MRSHVRRYPTPGHTYYYDATAGNDAARGSGEDAPLQTVAGLNAKALRPRDRVLFKRGEAWSGTDWVVAVSGKAGAPITFGAYGAGALPAITGQNHAAETLAADGQGYLAFRDLDIAGSANSNFAIRLQDCRDVTLTRVTARDAHVYFGIYVNDTGVGKTLRPVVEDCTVHGNHATGLAVQYNGVALPLRGPAEIAVLHNTVYSNGTAADADHGMYLRECTSGVVLGNSAYSNPVGAGIKLNTCTGLLVEGNHCYSNKHGMVASAEYAATCACRVVNNVLDHNAVDGFQTLANANGMTFAGNTVVDNVGKAIDMYNDVTGWVFSSNVLYQDKNDGVNAWSSFCVNMAAGSTNLVNNTWDYNDLVYISSWAGNATLCQIGVVTYTLVQWQALGGSPEVHGTGVAPVFVTNWSNFHLQAASGLRGIGDTAVGLMRDYDGVPRGVAVDIGAYEYV